MEVQTISELVELKSKLSIISPSPKRVFVGFDGFVDTIMKAVKQRLHYSNVYFDTIKEFASRINAASGKSGQLELVSQYVKLGGNAPILSNTLGKLSIQSYCVGSLGYPDRHAVFSAMDPKCKVISLCNPGESRAVEFSDGKIILSELSSFANYNWRSIKESPLLGQIQDAICDSSVVAFVDWANLPYATEIWEGILEEVIKPSHRRDFHFFFDLCDPTKKTTEQIDEVLDLMSSFSSCGKVTVALNENETLKILCAIRGIEKKITLKEAGEALFKAMSIDRLLVHPIDRTILFSKQGTIELEGRLVTEPKILTGGGDNLNAGFILGHLHNFTIRQCMLLGMATSGAYIQNGASPDIPAVLKYIDRWISDLEHERMPAQVLTH